MNPELADYIEDARRSVGKAVGLLHFEELPDKEAIDMILDNLNDAIHELSGAVNHIGMTIPPRGRR